MFYPGTTFTAFLVSAVCLMLVVPAQSEEFKRVVVSEVVLPADEGGLEAAEFDFQRLIVLRLSFQQSSAGDTAFEPYPIHSEKQLMIRLQDTYPDYSQVLYPDSIRRINEHEFYVTLPRIMEIPQGVEGWSYLVVSDFEDVDKTVTQVFWYRAADLLRW